MTDKILIETDEILVQAIDALTLLEPRFARVIEHTGLPKLRSRPDGFKTLLQAIIVSRFQLQPQMPFGPDWTLRI